MCGLDAMPILVMCLCLENEQEDDLGESGGPAGSSLSPRLSFAPWVSGLAQCCSAPAGTRNYRMGSCLLLQHHVSIEQVVKQH